MVSPPLKSFVTTHTGLAWPAAPGTFHAFSTTISCPPTYHYLVISLNVAFLFSKLSQAQMFSLTTPPRLIYLSITSPHSTSSTTTALFLYSTPFPVNSTHLHYHSSSAPQHPPTKPAYSAAPAPILVYGSLNFPRSHLSSCTTRASEAPFSSDLVSPAPSFPFATPAPVALTLP